MIFLSRVFPQLAENFFNKKFKYTSNIFSAFTRIGIAFLCYPFFIFMTAWSFISITFKNYSYFLIKHYYIHFESNFLNIIYLLYYFILHFEHLQCFCFPHHYLIYLITPIIHYPFNSYYFIQFPFLKSQFK